MKVKELIELLNSMPQDHDVVLSKDEEGNGFSICDGHSTGVFDPNGTDWDSFDSRENWTQEFQGGDREDPYPGDNCIVLWP